MEATGRVADAFQFCEMMWEVLIKPNRVFFWLLLEVFLLSGFGKRNSFTWKCIYNFVEKHNSKNGSIGCPAFNHCSAARVKSSAVSRLITPLWVRLPRRCHF